MKELLLSKGGKIWEKEGIERVYISLELFNEVTGLGYSLNETKNKFYFDVKLNCICRRYKTGKPTIEKQF